jgi:hypothetical protein
MTFRYIRVFSFVILYSAFSGRAQQWPSVLAFPSPPDTMDSNTTELTSGQEGQILKSWDTGKNRINMWESENALVLRCNNERRYVSQSVGYNASLNTLRGRSHYVDIPGEFSRKQFPFRFSSVGLEWTPYFQLTADPRASDTRGSLHVGPVVGLMVKGVPVLLRGGGAVDIWNDSLPSSISDFRPGAIRGTERDLGVYAGMRIGESHRRIISSIPLFAEAGAYVREQDSMNIATTIVNGTFLNDIGTGDSIFLHAADSLAMGKSAFISDQAGGQRQYSATPHRVRHVIAVSAGVRARARMYLMPAAAYEYSLATIRFPGFLGDEKKQTHSVLFQLKSVESFFVEYEGAIRFGFLNEDWMYRFNVPMLKPSEPSYLADTLSKNLFDNDEFITAMKHQLRKYFENGLGLSYSFDISRSQTTYPNFFVSQIAGGFDTTRLNDDRDRINHHHLLDMTLVSLVPVTVTASGEYIKGITSYVRREKSIQNNTERIYRIGGGISVRPLTGLSFSEKAGANAITTSDQFPRPDDYPSYRRWFDSELKGIWAVRPWISVDGQWYAKYGDDGNWVGGEYRDTSVQSSTGDYYAIVNKSLETMLELASSLLIREMASVRLGATYRDFYDRAYDNGFYATRHNTGYMLTPFVNVSVRCGGRLSLDLSIRRYIDTQADDYWDVGGTIHAVF